MGAVAVALELVDQQALDAAPSEIEGEREAHRAAADDENGSFDVHERRLRYRDANPGARAIELNSRPSCKRRTTFSVAPRHAGAAVGAGRSDRLIARVLQPKMSERLGQPFVVENRPGGSAVIASSAVAKAQPDGHTLLLALSAHSINPIALKELPYDTFRDFAPVTLLARFPLIVGANPGVKGSNLAESSPPPRDRQT